MFKYFFFFEILKSARICAIWGNRRYIIGHFNTRAGKDRAVEFILVIEKVCRGDQSAHAVADHKNGIRPDFNRSIFIDFCGAKITSATPLPGGVQLATLQKACIEKWLAKIWQERYFQNTW